ncbi:MAG: hypothetical protein M1816_005869 [Peltula sp. TS41687]|nr:MAG: hypothetical protein M1816_005869 [Peltula sp. TS41687]
MTKEWFCGYCGDGPLSVELVSHCPLCGNRRDQYARVEVYKASAEASAADRRASSESRSSAGPVNTLPEVPVRQSSPFTLYQAQEVGPPQRRITTSSTEQDLLGPLESDNTTLETIPLVPHTSYGVESSPNRGSAPSSQNTVIFRGNDKRSSSMHESSGQITLYDAEAYSSGTSTSLEGDETGKTVFGAAQLLRQPVTDRIEPSQGNRPDISHAEGHPLRLSDLSPIPQSQPSQEGSIPISGYNRESVTPLRAGSRCILLCMPAFASKEQVEYAMIASCVTDRQMYMELHKKYYTWWRTAQRWITMRRLSRVHFVRFQIYWARYVAIEATDIGRRPPLPSRDYQYIPIDLPPASMTDYLEYPTHAPSSSRRHLDGIPKRLSINLSLFPHDLPDNEGYGLQISERVCWMKVCILEGLIGAGALIFAVSWCRYHNASAQDGFTVAAVILAYGTIILGLLQGVSQYYHARS